MCLMPNTFALGNADSLCWGRLAEHLYQPTSNNFLSAKGQFYPKTLAPNAFFLKDLRSKPSLSILRRGIFKPCLILASDGKFQDWVWPYRQTVWPTGQTLWLLKKPLCVLMKCPSLEQRVYLFNQYVPSIPWEGPWSKALGLLSCERIEWES